MNAITLVANMDFGSMVVIAILILVIAGSLLIPGDW